MLTSTARCRGTLLLKNFVVLWTVDPLVSSPTTCCRLHLLNIELTVDSECSGFLPLFRVVPTQLLKA